MGETLLDDVFRSEYEFILGPLYVIFILIVTIVLLNLLIAILTSAYEKIKLNEDARFLAGLAAIIYEVKESSLPEVGEDRFDFEYLHVLEPKHYQIEKEVEEWQGTANWLRRFIPQSVKQELAEQLQVFEKRQTQLLEAQLQTLQSSLDDKRISYNNDLDRKASYPPKYLLAHQQDEFIKQLNRFQKEIDRIKTLLQQES
eukprot:TRINITY_DN2502_c0_g2_i1.p2 TRINITY_DN2502_c0_g2~~TRINITY_DN2502_c0_g2_i1.p2  ORF type:complete len:200 (-),score=23.81 TRINITY_DN2502_c0_g2_i1:261-860(-)